MKWNERTFRNFYHQWMNIEMTEEIRSKLKGWKGASTANWVFTYGYIDNELGFCFEVLSATRQHVTDHLFTMKDPNNEVRVTLLPEDIQGLEIYFFDEKRTKYRNKYAHKLQQIEESEYNPALKEVRQFRFIDHLRDPALVDYVNVFIESKSQNKTESVWVKLVGLGEHEFIAILLQEPKEIKYIHAGDQIEFNLQKVNIDGNEKVIAISMVDQFIQYGEKELEDGSVLKEAIHAYYEQQNMLTYQKVIGILKESSLEIPIRVVLSDEDSKMIEDMIQENPDDLNHLKGKEFSFNHEVRCIPDILTNGKEEVVPVFSCNEGFQYEDDISFITVDFQEVIRHALSHIDHTSGLMINPFGESFFLEHEMLERLKEDE